jgi:hypothetical protein
MIAVDISKPDSCLEGLKKWLGQVKKFAQQRNQGLYFTQLLITVHKMLYDILFLK